MFYWLVVAGTAVVLLLLVIVTWRPLRAWAREVQAARARELFTLQRERLEAKFLDAASATGKPRGLRWKNIDWDGEPTFARDRESGRLTALVAVTIQFEAIPGSDMEGVEAVGNLRNASAVFFFERGQWQTTGKAIFNLNPSEAIDRFKQQYELI
jgi:hypothetical protein